MVVKHFPRGVNSLRANHFNPSETRFCFRKLKNMCAPQEDRAPKAYYKYFPLEPAVVWEILI